MWNCAGCKHYRDCQDDKKVGCKKRDIDTGFKEFVDTMVDAYTSNDHDTLDRMEKENVDWFKEVMDSMSCLL